MAPQTRQRKQSNADVHEKRKRDDVKSEGEGERPVKAAKSETKCQTAKDKTDKDKDNDEHADSSSESPKKQSSPTSTVKWLLSEEAFRLANPPIDEGHGEVDWGQGEEGRPRPEALPPVDDDDNQDGHSQTKTQTKSKSNLDENGDGKGGFRYPQSNMTPFQTLLTSLLLSKPLSHRLGIRTINTLFNPPYAFDRFTNLQNATEDERRASLWQARTQHKEKTAIQLTSLVESVQGLSNKQGGGGEDELSILRDEIKGLKKDQALDWIGKRLIKEVNGIGKGGIDIFCRRVQEQWVEIYPFADQRCLTAAKQLGLLSEEEDVDQLVKLTEVGVDGKEAREKFVRLLDVLIGLDLEKKIEQVKEKLGV